MATSTIGTSAATIKCCPELQEKPVCDTLSFRYRLPFQAKAGKDTQRVPVEVVLHFELTRCTGPLTIGDPIYSTTLLPGEQVRLFTSDRHTHWSYDSESQLSYRHETTSEESYYTHAMAEAISDITASDEVQADSSFESSWAKGAEAPASTLESSKLVVEEAEAAMTPNQPMTSAETYHSMPTLHQAMRQPVSEQQAPRQLEKLSSGHTLKENRKRTMNPPHAASVTRTGVMQ